MLQNQNMKAIIPYAIVALLAAAGAILLMRGCDKTTPLQQNKTAVDSAGQADAAYHKSLQSEIDRLEGDSATAQDVIDNQARQLAWYEAQLSNTGEEIGQTIKVMDSVRIIHDTPALVSSCDTLENQVEAARVQIHGFRLATDSLLAERDHNDLIKDSLTRIFRSAFLHADSAGNFYKDQYNTLFKKQKRSILTEKVLVGAGAALILGLLIKK